jgi:hypothetical protein
MNEKFSFNKIALTLAALSATGVVASTAAASPMQLQEVQSSLDCDGDKKKDKDSSLAELDCDGDKKKDKDSSLLRLSEKDEKKGDDDKKDKGKDKKKGEKACGAKGGCGAGSCG